MSDEPLFAVRIQGSNRPLAVEGGSLRILRPPRDGNFRNTVHFAVNSAVDSHAYGTFDGDAVVVAPLEDLGVPAGLSQVDVWVHADDAFGVSVGPRAVVIWPDDATAPPDGVNAILYDASGGLDARNAAVDAYLRSQGAEPRRSGFWSWAGEGMGDAEAWERSAASALYGPRASKVHRGAHCHSADGSAEDRLASAWKLSFIAQERYSIRVDGVDRPSCEAAREALEAAEAILDAFELRPPPPAGPSEAFISSARESMARAAERVAEAEIRWSRPFIRVDPGSDSSPLSFDELESLARSGALSRSSSLRDIRSEGPDTLPASEILGPRAVFAESSVRPPPLSVPHPLPVDGRESLRPRFRGPH